MITIHQRYRQTDGQTDRQTTCDRNTALCTTVHRAVKTCAIVIGRLKATYLLTYFHTQTHSRNVMPSEMPSLWTS